MQGVFEPTELGRLTEDLSSNFSAAMEKAGLDFRVRCETLTEPVYVDRDMWEKIVLNLISNALKFTFEGSVTVALKQTESQVEFTVSDTGSGIPAEELSHIFERFHRVESSKSRTIEGTGIGLALVQELVKLHGGSISVKSELNVGSVFQVCIPLGTAHLAKDKIRASGHTSTSLHPDAFIDEAWRWLPAPEEAQTPAVQAAAGPTKSCSPTTTAICASTSRACWLRTTR